MVERASEAFRSRLVMPWLALPPFWRATFGGILGTFAMTVWIYVTQVFGISQIEIARALASLIGIDHDALLLGTALHVVVGVGLGLIYAYGFHVLLPGPGWVRGLVYSLLPTTGMLALMPLLAWGLILTGAVTFGPLAVTMWIVNQLVYGLVLGLFYGAD